MNRHLPIGCIVLTLATACRDRGGLPARNVSDLVARHVAAVGGEEALRALRSWRFLWKVDGLMGAQGFIETSAKAPGRVRIASTIGRSGTTLIFDGRSGWSQQNGTTSRIADDKVERLRGRASLDDLLACRGEPGCRITRGADAVIAGVPCYRIDLAWPHGYRVSVILNGATFLIARTVTTLAATAKRGPVTVETSPSDYRTIGGLTVPFATRVSGEYGAYTIALAAFEPNVAVDDAVVASPQLARSTEP